MRVASIFSDHMVVQRDAAIPVWGWDVPGQRVTVELAGQAAAATAGADGRWQVSLPALPAGGPHMLTARGSETIVLGDVLVGEVWICSGQSNMEWPLSMAANGAEEVAAADFPAVRLYMAPKRISLTPVDDIAARWASCTPKNAATFSAVGYFFGRELHRRLGVPVGLINSSWGGTNAQTWTSAQGLASDPALGGYLEDLARARLLTEGEAEAAFQAARREFLAKLPQDAGNRGFADGWAAPDHDDRAWGSMELPDFWTRTGLLTHGVVWFRREVIVPAGWCGGDLRLSLGAVDKNDDTYFNGVRVGGLTWAEAPQSWCTPRDYTVSAGLVKPGRNTIAVRAMSNYTGGGMAGPAMLMQLAPADRTKGQPVSLAGAWRCRIEQNFGVVPQVPEPASPRNQNMPTALFNGMVAPLIPFAMRGAIWYQGESNAADAARYRALFSALIRDWRRRWGLGDFPFHFVQLANYVSQGKEADFADEPWPRLREAQSLTRSLPRTGMAVTIDIGEARDIHPRNKQDVGLRLARCALALDYGQPVACLGPQFESLRREAGALRIEFAHAEGLRAEGGVVRGLAVAGADRVFHVANARIEGTCVVASCPDVKEPVAARYGWSNCPTCTLYNRDNLPAEPFRTDDWPLT
jgi:sialate O-acetylesterase